MPLLKLGAFLQSKITSTRKCFPFHSDCPKSIPCFWTEVKGHQWMIWVIIDYPQTKQELLDWGLLQPNQQSRSSLCAWIWISPPPRTLQRVTTLPFPSLQFPIMAELIPLLTLPWYYFDVYTCRVSSGFYFKPTSSSSSILIDPV